MAVNGIFEGYRWYDVHNVAPLYPFGYGLSYARFVYSGLRVTRSAGGGLDVTVRVRNAGAYAGSDVPQVYAGPSSALPADVQRAVRKLVRFQRVDLAPGRAVDLTMHVAPRELSSWPAAAQAWVVGTGLRTVFVGSSSRDLPLSAAVRVTGP
jgi:beta-glucosidase